MKKRLLIVICLAFLFTGCAAKTKFLYNYPHPEITSSNSTGLILAYKRIDDQRPKPAEIDKIYDKNPLEDINKIIEEEIKSTGLFKNIILIPDDKINDEEYLKKTNVELLMNSALMELKWEVPNYESMIQKVFIISFLTGGIGGVAYGSTKVDVYGDTKLKITLIDLDSGNPLIDKEYIGHSEEKMAKLKCDTSSTKASIVGKAIKTIMQEFKADLDKVVKTIKERN